MRFLITILLLTYFTTSISQARMVFNNGSYVNIENNAYLVIDNSNANAITLAGTGGNILSENENDLVKWNIGNTTGNHIVPFTNTNGIKIPVEINITTAGSADGSLLLSTYRTNNMNIPWPAVGPAVTNMCSPFVTTDASLFVMDRFWRIDGNSYTNKPAATLSFGYDFANEAGGANTIIEPNLQAQRFNPGIGSGTIPCTTPSLGFGNWEHLLFGSANTATKRVNNVVISSADFFKDWILVDNTKPLPVTLLNFDANCEREVTVLSWSTASESNNDYFTIEKSTDGVNFSKISKIQGSGNSTNLINYTFKDNAPSNDISYYRLKQVDFNGQHEYFDIIASSCSLVDFFVVTNTKLDDNNLEFDVLTDIKEELTISLYDYSGKLLVNEKSLANEGSNKIKLTDLELAKGIYILNVMGQRHQCDIKILKQ